MPIYKSNVYSVAKNVPIQKYIKLVEYLKKSMKEFPFKNNFTFIDSIEIDQMYHDVRYVGKYNQIYDKKQLEELKNKPLYVANYENLPKLNISDYNYTTMLESLITQTNSMISRNEKYLLDIVGSWTKGKIIILNKK